MRRLWDFADDHREQLAIALLLGGMLAAGVYFLAQPTRGEQREQVAVQAQTSRAPTPTPPLTPVGGRHRR